MKNEKIMQYQSIPLNQKDVLSKLKNQWSLSRLFKFYRKRDSIKRDSIILCEILTIAKEKEVIFPRTKILYVISRYFEERINQKVKKSIFNQFSHSINSSIPFFEKSSLEMKKQAKNNTMCYKKNSVAFLEVGQ